MSATRSSVGSVEVVGVQVPNPIDAFYQGWDAFIEALDGKPSGLKYDAASRGVVAGGSINFDGSGGLRVGVGTREVNVYVEFGFDITFEGWDWYGDGVYDPVADARAALREEFPNVPREMIEGVLANAAKSTIPGPVMPESNPWEFITERDLENLHNQNTARTSPDGWGPVVGGDWRDDTSTMARDHLIDIDRDQNPETYPDRIIRLEAGYEGGVSGTTNDRGDGPRPGAGGSEGGDYRREGGGNGCGRDRDTGDRDTGGRDTGGRGSEGGDARREGGGTGGTATGGAATGGSTTTGSGGWGSGSTTAGGGGRDSGGVRRDDSGRTTDDPNFTGPQPILLDLDGDGIEITQASQSTQFVIGADGLDHRTAWAGAGDGVLFIDADGSGDISNLSEYVFTEWDASAGDDLEALRRAFDSMGDGKLTAADARWGEFRVQVTNAALPRRCARRVNPAIPRQKSRYGKGMANV